MSVKDASVIGSRISFQLICEVERIPQPT